MSLGIDLSSKSLKVAQLHALEAQTPMSAYREVSAEALAARAAGQLRCGDLHGNAGACARPGVCRAGLRHAGQTRGDGCFSPPSTATQGFHAGHRGAEYVLNMLPRGTHEYAKMIRPSELAGHCREAGLDLQGTRGWNTTRSRSAIG
jgi:2-polyprenyl-6-hydroxyphenyl methylase/3-demethylubiquinone-9 3-methyltransferase